MIHSDSPQSQQDPKHPQDPELGTGTEQSEKDRMFKSIAIFKKRAFKARDSIFSDPNSFSQKSLWNFSTIFTVILIIFVITRPIFNYFAHGYFFNPVLFNSFAYDIMWILGKWPLFTLWSYTSFIIQKLALKNTPLSIVYTLQYITEALTIILGAFLVLHYDLEFLQSTFILLQSIIHTMKMHSYNVSNIFFREEWHESRKRGWRPCSNYPHNITLEDFTYFLIAPTLVYWYEFPKNEKFRPQFLASKICQTILGLVAIYLIVSDIILPIINLGQSITYLQAIIMLSVPVFLVTFTIFYVLFDCILNCIAEMIGFADREFYLDWWNSTSYEEFYRKLDKISHEFLFRHVYCETLFKFDFPKSVAIFATVIFHSQIWDYLFNMISRTSGVFLMILGLAQLLFVRAITFILKGKLKSNHNIPLWFTIIIGLPWALVHYLPSDQFA